MPSDLTLKANDVKYFMFEHLAETSFKLIILEEYGTVKMYANKSKEFFNSKLKNNEVLEYKDFKLRGERENILSVSPDD